MTAHRDQAGRPVVVVTGLGVVTSLGIGKADNWQKLTAGTSGIHSITRFATEGLKTRIAAPSILSPSTTRRAGTLRTARRDRCRRGDCQAAIGTRGLSRTAICGGAALELEWPQRRASRPPPAAMMTRSPTGSSCAAPAAAASLISTNASCSDRSDGLAATFGTKGSPINSRLPAPPAPLRSNLASRRSVAAKPCRALHRHGRIGQSGIFDPLLCSPLCRRRTIYRRRRQSRSRRTAMASSWRKAPARSSSKAWTTPSRAARKSLV